MCSSIISATSISFILDSTHCSGGGRLVISRLLWFEVCFRLAQGVHVWNRELAHPLRIPINIARRRPGSDHAADDLVQHIHLRQPRPTREWRPAVSPRVLPTGGLAGPRGL